jgi:predicted GTPase
VRRVRSHIVLTAEQALAGALWVMMAWVHADAAVHSPMLLITSTDPNCGKSTLADVCRYLAPRGINTVETTSASLYRLIDMYEPTIFVDEADEILVNPTRQRE